MFPFQANFIIYVYFLANADNIHKKRKKLTVKIAAEDMIMFLIVRKSVCSGLNIIFKIRLEIDKSNFA